jgi:hypothetical protein
VAKTAVYAGGNGGGGYVKATLQLQLAIPHSAGDGGANRE